MRCYSFAMAVTVVIVSQTHNTLHCAPHDCDRVIFTQCRYVSRFQSVNKRNKETRASETNSAASKIGSIRSRCVWFCRYSIIIIKINYYQRSTEQDFCSFARPSSLSPFHRVCCAFGYSQSARIKCFSIKHSIMPQRCDRFYYLCVKWWWWFCCCDCRSDYGNDDMQTAFVCCSIDVNNITWITKLPMHVNSLFCESHTLIHANLSLAPVPHNQYWFKIF